MLANDVGELNLSPRFRAQLFSSTNYSAATSHRDVKCKYRFSVALSFSHGPSSTILYASLRCNFTKKDVTYSRSIGC